MVGQSSEFRACQLKQLLQYHVGNMQTTEIVKAKHAKTKHAKTKNAYTQQLLILAKLGRLS